VKNLSKKSKQRKLEDQVKNSSQKLTQKTKWKT